MKKTIITLAVATLLCAGASAKSLKVYSVTGNVTKKEGTAWNKVAKANVLTDAATVKITPPRRFACSTPPPGRYIPSPLPESSTWGPC